MYIIAILTYPIKLPDEVNSASTHFAVVETPDQFFEVWELGSDSKPGCDHEDRTVFTHRRPAPMGPGDPGKMESLLRQIVGLVVLSEIEGSDLVRPFVELTGQPIFGFNQ